ncbi:MAG: hypothetical protein II743_02005 [Lachnospiraceae bacterium]|nr:hypothetical protein [Lachnospiraceae bacterium]
MRKIIAVVSAFVIVLAMSFPAKAATKSGAIVSPGLSFSGTTATCSLEVYAPYATDSITASITLKRGNTVVKQWTNLTDSGIMDFSDTANVSHWQTYTMHVTLSINGISYTVSDITKTCP